VLASEIQSLKNRVGYLRLSGQEKVRHVKVPRIRGKPVVEAFVPRPRAARVPTVVALPSTLIATPATEARQPALDAEAIMNAGRARQ